MNKRKALLKRRSKAYDKMPKTMDVLRGSAVLVNRLCGKPNCRCKNGFKHQSLYLSQSHKGKARMIYVPEAGGEKLKQYIIYYRKIKDVLNQVSDINIKLLTKAKDKG